MTNDTIKAAAKFTLKQGKFGPYYYEEGVGDLTLADVLYRLNYYSQKAQLSEGVKRGDFDLPADLHYLKRDPESRKFTKVSVRNLETGKVEDFVPVSEGVDVEALKREVQAKLQRIIDTAPDDGLTAVNRHWRSNGVIIGGLQTIEYIAAQGLLAGTVLPKWLPIETAPKDGSVFLAWSNKFKAVLMGSMYEFPDRGFKVQGWNFVSNALTSDVTDWMPLPAAPKGKTDE